MRRFTSSPKGAFSHDLHVLGTPPAFVLSQDQTLRLKNLIKEAGTPARLAPQTCTKLEKNPELSFVNEGPVSNCPLNVLVRTGHLVCVLFAFQRPSHPESKILPRGTLHLPLDAERA